jgi:tetratricopeptide (TPR) repeat protein
LLTVPVESLRDASRAESVASSAVNLASESPRFIRTLALAQLKTGRLEPAAESLKKAEVLIETEHPEDQLLRAMLVFKQGDKDQAQQLYVAGTALMDAASPANPRLLMIRQEAATLLGVVVPVRKDEPDVPAELTN